MVQRVQHGASHSTSCNEQRAGLKNARELPTQNGVIGTKVRRMETIQRTRYSSSPGTNIMRMVAINRNGRILALAFLSTWLFSCNPCGDTLKGKAVTADNQLVANFYEHDCGATTDISSIVNVQRTSDTFHADDGILFVAKGRYDLSVTWTGPRTILITCPNCSRQNIFRELVALGDIDVRYRFASNSVNDSQSIK